MKKNLFFMCMFILFLTLSICFIGCSENENINEKKQQPAVSWDLIKTKQDSIDITKLKNLLAIFETNCKYLRQYPEAIAKKEVQIIKYRKGENPSYTEREYGWLTEAVLSITIKDDAKLPSALTTAQGVTLNYFIGAGHTPGIVIMKDIAAVFYGVETSRIVNGKNTFIANDQYSIVDTIPIIFGESYSKINTLDDFINTYNKVSKDFNIKQISKQNLEKGASIDTLKYNLNDITKISAYFKQDEAHYFSSLSIKSNKDTDYKNIKFALTLIVSVIDTKNKSEIEKEVSAILSQQNQDAYTTSTGLVYKVYSTDDIISISITPQ